jgi:mRNA interferase MazF
VRRGEIWWASTGAQDGAETDRRRPVLIVQVNAFNRSSIPTVLVVTVTSNLALADAPGNVRLTPEQSGLPRDAVVDVSRIVTIDREQLAEPVGPLPARQMAAVEDGLRLALAL